MKKIFSIKKAVLALGICFIMLGTSIQVNAASTAYKSTPYGQLYGSIGIAKVVGRKEISYYTSIGQTVSYISAKIDMKNNSTGAALGSDGIVLNNTTSAGDYFEDHSGTLYNITVAVFGAHEVRKTYSYVVYTSTAG